MPRKSLSSAKVFYPRFSRDELVALLQERLYAVSPSLPIKRAVLFGSWATGRATAFSDIDLLVVYVGPPRKDAYELVRKAIALRGLEPHVYDEVGAQRVAPTIERMTRGGVVLDTRAD